MKFTKASECKAEGDANAFYRTVFNFRIVQHNGPKEINNLWSLMLTDQDGAVKDLVVNADTLGACVDMLSHVMEQAGF